MRRILRSMTKTRDDRVVLFTDALGAFALFVLAYAALHLPLMT
ncbi:hypothetical protein [Pararhodobacter sp.]|nr:hypothetical protein [Pararhodobacter sp.]